MLSSLFLALLLAVNMEVGDGQARVWQVGTMPDMWSDGTALVEVTDTTQTPEAQARLAVWRWFPEEEVDYVLCLAWKESRYDRWALGAAGERGILQISPYWNRHVLAEMGYTPDDLFDINRNVQVAAEIRNRWGNYNAWTTARLCRGS